MKHRVSLSKRGKNVQLFAAAQQAGAKVEVEPVPSWFDHEWSQYGTTQPKKAEERRDDDSQKS